MSIDREACQGPHRCGGDDHIEILLDTKVRFWQILLQSRLLPIGPLPVRDKSLVEDQAVAFLLKNGRYRPLEI